MLVIHKYQVEIGEANIMPAGARLLSVQYQKTALCVWAVADTAAPLVNRRFAVFGTGWDMTPEAAVMPHVGTVQEPGTGLVWHVFDVGEYPL
jgi:hypothetical protein